MTKTATRSGKAMSVPGGIAISSGISLGITVLGSMLLAKLLDTGHMNWVQAGYWIMAMVFLAAFLGARGGIHAIKRQKAVVASLAGVLYWGLLLSITALFFGGNYEAVLETAGLIIAGSGCAAMISGHSGRPGTRKRRKRQL